MRRSSGALAVVVTCLLLSLAVSPGLLLSVAARANPEKPTSANVTDADLLNADAQPQNWLTYGRTYSEQRFSPLKQINDKNAGRLGLAWYIDLDTDRGQEATPLVVDGVMYFTTAWSKVFAVNAATGARIWSYDPKVPAAWDVNLAATWSIAAWPSGRAKFTSERSMAA